MSDLDRLAEDIAAAGVRRVYGIPGSGASLSLIDGLERRGVGFHRTEFEGAAAIMAGTSARLSGRPGVALSIKGPGLANMVPGLAACRFEALPVVAIAEAYGPDSPPSRAHKRISHPDLVGAVAKGRRYHAAAGPSFAEMAAWAAAEVPAPVVLELAGAVAAEQPVAVAPQRADDPGLADMIAAARNPVVIAGTLALRRGWSNSLNGLGIPVFSTAAAKGVVDETLPHAAGVYTGVGLARAPETTILPQADLIVGVGLRAQEVLSAKPFACLSVNLDVIAGEAHAGLGFAGVAGDGGAAFAALAGKRWDGPAPDALCAALRMHLLSLPFGPAHVLDALHGRFRGRARLVLDTGYFCTIGEHVWRAPEARLCLGSGQGRYMGIGLPMAVAAAQQDGPEPTILATGDGGIGMFVGELRAAVAQRLPLLVVLLSDGGFGSVRTRAVKDGLTQRPLLMADASWVDIMAGFGLPGTVVESAPAMADAAAAWDPASGPAFIEARFDPVSYQAMVEGVRG